MQSPSTPHGRERTEILYEVTCDLSVPDYWATIQVDEDRELLPSGPSLQHLLDVLADIVDFIGITDRYDFVMTCCKTV